MASKKTHVALPGSNRPEDDGTVWVRDVDPAEKIDVTIALAGPKLPGPDEFVGQPLSPKEFAAKFSAAQTDADKVARSLRKLGLNVESVSLATRTMRVSGTADAMEAAFKPGLAILRSARQAGEYRGRHGTLQIPAELKGVITGVFGLDERRMARRKATAVRAAPATAHVPLSPSDLEERYNFPPGDAAGQSIAIAEFGGGYFAEDTAAYCNEYGRATPNVQAIAVDAPAYTLEQALALPPRQRKMVLGDSTEVMMDVEVIAGLCPAANITVLFSTFDEQGWIDLISEVIKLRPVALSVSWGLAEEDPTWSSGAIASINDVLNAARLVGITVCVASGDDGSGDQVDDGKAHVDFPSSSPFTLGVGGTMLTVASGSVDEVSWWESPGRRTDNGGGSSGGGVSMKFKRPTWQKVRVQSLNAGSIDGRIVPDVSALAGNPLYALIFVGKSSPNGGTSASAPLWAALIARINAKLPPAKRQRFLTPLLYQVGADGRPVGEAGSRDVISGNNISNPVPGRGYTAGPGFDAVTGWGVPDGAKLLKALEAV